jgi:hypothetical protein
LSSNSSTENKRGEGGKKGRKEGRKEGGKEEGRREEGERVLQSWQCLCNCANTLKTIDWGN